MRLMAQAKCGFYPTPESVVSIVARHMIRRKEGLIRLLDPCAGQGTALAEIGRHLNAETFGIEIDRRRGAQAQKVLTRCLVTDYQNVRVSPGAFSLLWLNPPYDWAARDDELDKSERYERTFLRECIFWLQPGGILVYLIPQRRMDIRVARILSFRFQDISVYRFPEAEYQAFKQVVVIGRFKAQPGEDDQVVEYLTAVGRFQAIAPFLPEEPGKVYEVPVSSFRGRLVFRNKGIDPDELAAEAAASGLYQQAAEQTTPLRLSERIRPIMPLRHGHLAQILACGLMNGVVRDQAGKNPLLVKGVTRKEVIKSMEMDGDLEKHIETDRIRIVIHAFNQDGELLTIE